MILCLILAVGLQDWTLHTDNFEEIIQIQDMAVGDDDSLYLLDRREARIYVVNTAGEVQRSFGSKGQGPGEFQAPGSLVFFDGMLYVWDFQVSGWSMYHPDGTFQAVLEVGRRSNQSFPLDRTRLLVRDVNDYFKKDVTGAEMLVVEGEQKTALRKYDVSQHAGPFVIRSKVGMTSHESDWLPLAVFAYAPASKRLYLGHTAALDLWIMDSATYKKVGAIKAKLPVMPFTDEDIESRKMVFVRDGKKYGTKDLPGLPDVKPVILKLQADELGRVWVFLTPSNIRSRTVEVWVYDQQGRKQGRLLLPRHVKIARIDKSHLWVWGDHSKRDDQFIARAPYKLGDP